MSTDKGPRVTRVRTFTVRPKIGATDYETRAGIVASFIREATARGCPMREVPITFDHATANEVELAALIDGDEAEAHAHLYLGVYKCSVSWKNRQ